MRAFGVLWPRVQWLGEEEENRLQISEVLLADFPLHTLPLHASGTTNCFGLSTFSVLIFSLCLWPEFLLSAQESHSLANSYSIFMAWLTS